MLNSQPEEADEIVQRMILDTDSRGYSILSIAASNTEYGVVEGVMDHPTFVDKNKVCQPHVSVPFSRLSHGRKVFTILNVYLVNRGAI